MLPGFSAAQDAPKVIVLGAAVTSPILNNLNPSATKREKSLRGWLVCNGAQADRTIFAELLDAIGDIAGPASDGMFRLPLYPLEMRGGDPVRGIAICPSAQFGMTADLMAFNLDSNL
jgi:hypothetical protein